MFSKFAKFSETESNIILVTFRNYSALGIGLPKSIEMLAENEANKKLGQAYRRLSYAIHEKNIDPTIALQDLGIISSIEGFVLKKSKSTKFAIDDIMDMRKRKNKYESSLIKMFLPSILWFYGTIALIPFVSGKLEEAREYLVTLLKVSKDIDISNQIILPFYTQNPNLISTVPFLVLILFIGFYIYNYIRNPFILYKFFKGKAYSDIAIFLNILSVLKSTGENSHQIFEIMLKSGKFKKENNLLRILFSKKTLYDVFQQFHYPKDIVNVIKMGEQTKSFWKNLPALIVFCNESSASALYRLDVFWKKPVYMLSMFVAISFAISLFLLAINGMNFMLQMAM